MAVQVVHKVDKVLVESELQPLERQGLPDRVQRQEESTMESESTGGMAWAAFQMPALVCSAESFRDKDGQKLVRIRPEQSFQDSPE